MEMNFMENNNKINVLFLWDVEDRLKNYLHSKLVNITNLNLIYPKDLDQNNLMALGHTAQVLIGWRPTFELLENANNLKLFINPGAGVQHLIPLFTKINPKTPIVLVNGHGNSYFTAQHAVALLLSLINKVIPHHEWMKEGKWRTGDDEAKSIPLWNKKVGLIGYGAINKKVHQILAGFQCEFSVLRRSWKGKKDDHLPIVNRFEPKEIRNFMKEVNFCIVAVPQTNQTVNMIDTEELKCLGKNGFLISIGRGGVINEEALFSALKENRLAGAAIDVWYEYSPEPNEKKQKYPYHFPFHDLSNIILSPHRAASPFDNLERWDEVVENLTRIAKGRCDFINQVNLTDEY
jgi:phosphoglycerate dehydrogenase-like enzyme